MKIPSRVIGLVAVAALAGAGYGVYRIGMHQGMNMAPPATGGEAGAMAADSGPMSIAQGEEATRRHISDGVKAGDVDPVNGKKILYYHDPMVPGNKFDKPAKSPFMDMMLVPVYVEADGGDASKVTVSPRIQQNLGVRTAEVVSGTLSPTVTAVGSIAYNERDQVIVQARATGFVERLQVRATLDRVAKGQALAELYVPDWIAAQEEFLSVRRMPGQGLDALVDAARQRMRQAGMSEAQIQAVERSGATQPRLTLTAPISGVVSELMVREGMTVMAGSTLFRINGLATVWAEAEVPESQAAWLRPGAQVQARSPAVPGETFTGKVQALLPQVNAITRTLKARLELANPRGRLVPGMFVQMQFMDQRDDPVLLVPTEAIIQTGQRLVVLLAEDDPATPASGADTGRAPLRRFRPVNVQIGLETGGQTEVRSGLRAGQRVVVSSQFLIDSEAQLKGVEARLNADPQASSAGASAAAPTAAPHRGEARVERIGRDEITLSHGPIASVKWPSMTMDFLLPKTPRLSLPRGLAVGDTVDFEFTTPEEGLPVLSGMRLLAPQPPAAASAGGSKP